MSPRSRRRTGVSTASRAAPAAPLVHGSSRCHLSLRRRRTLLPAQESIQKQSHRDPCRSPMQISVALNRATGDRAQQRLGTSRCEPGRARTVEQPGQSGWFEHGSLVDDGAVGNRHDFELEPRAARHFHFGDEPQSSSRFVRLDPPEVKRVADCGRVRVAPSPTHPAAAHQQVDRASDSPQPRSVIPP